MAESGVTNIRGNEANGSSTSNMSAEDIFRVQEERIQNLQNHIKNMEEEAKKEPLTLEEALGNLEPDEDYKPVYDIRPATHADFKRLVGMIRRVRSNEGLQGAIASGNQSAMINEGFTMLVNELEEEFLPWLADLARIDPEKLDEQPFGFTFDALNDLKNSPNFLGALRSATYFVMTGKRLFGR